MPVKLSPAEVRGILRIALHDGGQVVTVNRPDETQPVELGFSRPVAGEVLLWVDERGRPCRVGDPFEAAVGGTNLLPLEAGQIDALPGERERDRTLPHVAEYDVAVELSNLADDQLDGGRDTPEARGARERMRVLLDELDRRVLA